MTDWFDPRTWLRPLGDPAGAAREFLTGATTAWVDDLVRVARDRPIAIHHGGTIVRGTIRRIDARPVVTPTAWMSGDPRVEALERVTVVADDAAWNDIRLRRVRLTVDDIRVSPVGRPGIRTGPAVFEVDVAATTLSEWLADHSITVEQFEPDTGVIRVRYQWWRFPFEAAVVPEVTAHGVVLTIRELTVRGRAVPVPSRFHLALSVPVPLREDVRLTDIKVTSSTRLTVTGQAARIRTDIGVDQIIAVLRATSEQARFDVG